MPDQGQEDQVKITFLGSSLSRMGELESQKLYVSVPLW